MTRVLHLLDSTADWQQRIGLAQLFDRLPAERFHCQAAATDGAVRRAMLPAGGEVPLFPRPLGLDFLAAPALRRHLGDARIDLIHAWGVQAAMVAAAAAPSLPLVVALFDPLAAQGQAGKLRCAARPAGFALVCSTGTVRRRLIESGLDPALTVVIRPGVDLAAINAARRGNPREPLGLSPGQRVIITPGPATRGGGQFTAYWAAGVRSFVEPEVRLILPGISGEQARIARLAREHRLEHLLRCPGDGPGFQGLIAAADAMIVAPAQDVPCTAIAWAMGAGVPVIATAVPAIAEFISTGRNGLLAKPASPRSLAFRLAGMLEDRELLRRCAETARAQAYQVFSVRRWVAQHARLYENLRSGTAAGEGIIDPALEA